jgi:hypothetical protein
MNYDQTKIEETILALLAASSFDNGRAWKGYPFDAMDQLHAQGLIEDPRSRSKSVYLTRDGLERGNSLAAQLFGTSSDPHVAESS